MKFGKSFCRVFLFARHVVCLLRVNRHGLTVKPYSRISPHLWPVSPLEFLFISLANVAKQNERFSLINFVGGAAILFFSAEKAA